MGKGISMKSSQINRKTRKSEAGSALVYILIAIALLAALTVSFMRPSSQQTSSQSGFRTLTEVKNQIDQIRSGIQECVLRYPNGDQCINGNPDDATCTAGATDPGALEEYPLNPNSTYLLNPATDAEVRHIRCPGSNTGTRNDHKPIFAGSSGKFLPPKPDLFEEWQYFNGTDGVFFWTYTTKSDSFLKTSLDKLDESFGDDEAEVIDNSAATAPSNLESTGTAQCPDKSVCFRIWMIKK